MASLRPAALVARAAAPPSEPEPSLARPGEDLPFVRRPIPLQPRRLRCSSGRPASRRSLSPPQQQRGRRPLLPFSFLFPLSPSNLSVPPSLSLFTGSPRSSNVPDAMATLGASPAVPAGSATLPDVKRRHVQALLQVPFGPLLRPRVSSASNEDDDARFHRQSLHPLLTRVPRALHRAAGNRASTPAPFCLDLARVEVLHRFPPSPDKSHSISCHLPPKYRAESSAASSPLLRCFSSGRGGDDELQPSIPALTPAWASPAAAAAALFARAPS